MKIIFTLLTFILLITIESNAQWIQCGPFNSSVWAMTTVGSTIFVGIDRGIYKSSDNGENWSFAGLRSSNVRYLGMVDSKLVAIRLGQVNISLDSGKNWIYSKSDWGGKAYNKIILVGSTFYANDYSGLLYSSKDYGKTWGQVNVPFGQVSTLATNGSIIYAGTYEKGLFRSLDYGYNWEKVNLSIDKIFIYSVVSRGSTVLVGSANSGKVYRSMDNGDSWIEVHWGIKEGSVVLHVVDDTTYFISLSDDNNFNISNDAGESWTPVVLPNFRRNINAILSINAIIRNGSDLFLATSTNGVYRSTDNGKSWIEANNRLTFKIIHAVFTRNDTVFAGTNSGMYISTDNGNNWKVINSGINYGADIYSITQIGTLLFIGSNGGTKGNVGGGGVYRSRDNGDNWSEVSNGLTDENSFTPKIMCLAAVGTTLFAGTSNGIYRSLDSGKHWTSAGQSNPILLNKSTLSFAVIGTTLIAGTEANGMFRTTDNGEHWTSLSYKATAKIYSMAVVDDSILFLASGGISKSTDMGETWTKSKVSLDNQLIWSLGVHGTTLFAGFYGTIARSTDYGESWKNMENTFASDNAVFSIATTGKSLFAGTSIDGVWKYNLNAMDVAENPDEALEMKSFICYPNPASNFLTIDRTQLLMPDKVVQYIISDLTGRKIREFENAEQKFTIPLDGLSNGVYYLTIQQRRVRAMKMITVLQ